MVVKEFTTSIAITRYRFVLMDCDFMWPNSKKYKKGKLNIRTENCNTAFTYFE